MAAACGQARDHDRVVGRHSDFHLGQQPAEAGHLLLAEEVVGDQDVVLAALGHDLGLAELLAGDAAGARIALHGGDDRALVGLDVRPVGDAGRIAQGLHPRDVALDHVEIDHDGRRPELPRDLAFESLDAHDDPRSCSD